MTLVGEREFRIKLRLAWSMTILGVIVVMAGLCMGCSSATQAVANAQADYLFVADRASSICVEKKDPTFCKAYIALVQKYEHDLHLSAVSLGTKGKIPKQLKALADDAAAIDKATK